MNLNLLLASADIASEHGMEHAASAAEHAANHPGLMEVILGSNVINFILVVIFLAWIINKFKLLDAITNKQKAVIDKIKSSEEISKDAEQQFVQTEEKLKNIDIETKEILNEGKEISEGLAVQIQKETEKEKTALEEKYSKTIVLEEKMAAAEITKTISKAAIYIAEEHIKQAITEEKHHKYINDFIDNLENTKVR